MYNNSYFLFYGLTSLIFALALGYIFANNKWRNLTLVTFAFSVLIASVANCAARIALNRQSGFDESMTYFSFNVTFDTLVHWIVCFAYLMVILELGALVDKNIYLDNGKKLQSVSRCKCWLEVFTAIVVFLCLVLGLATYLTPTDWARNNGWFYIL
jgi:hypothetical protein